MHHAAASDKTLLRHFSNSSASQNTRCPFSQRNPSICCCEGVRVMKTGDETRTLAKQQCDKPCPRYRMWVPDSQFCDGLPQPPAANAWSPGTTKSASQPGSMCFDLGRLDYSCSTDPHPGFAGHQFQTRLTLSHNDWLLALVGLMNNELSTRFYGKTARTCCGLCPTKMTSARQNAGAAHAGLV